MNENHSGAVAENNKSSPLVERLDPSIGEVSTVMGAMMTELIRRALRGSLRQIDEELAGQVAKKLDATVAERMPAIEQSAAEAADKVARQAATEVAVEEVRALEERAREAERELSDKIATVQEKTEQSIARADELKGRIDEAARTVTTHAEEKARDLVGQIEAAGRRAEEAARAETSRQVEDVMQRARQTAAGFKDRLAALETSSSALAQQVETGAAAHKAEFTSLRNELAEARQRHEALAARVAELESPRGLRALWGRFFGRRKSESTALEPPPEPAEQNGA